MKFFGMYCNDTEVVHECVCENDGETRQILIHENDDGTTGSVKLFDKDFDSDEIERLKIAHGDSTETTFEIFQALDEITRACLHTQETIIDDVNGWKYIETHD